MVYLSATHLYKRVFCVPISHYLPKRPHAVIDLLFEKNRGAKVGQLYGSAGVGENVRRLHVAMHDPFRMQVSLFCFRGGGTYEEKRERTEDQQQGRGIMTLCLSFHSTGTSHGLVHLLFGCFSPSDSLRAGDAFALLGRVSFSTGILSCGWESFALGGF